MQSLPIERYLEIFNADELDNLSSHIHPIIEFPRNKEMLSMDMGGTNFRIAKVCFDNNGMAFMKDYTVQEMPGSTKKITFADFIDIINEKQRLYNAEKYGLCFSYPAEIRENRTARIINFSKEVEIQGAENQILETSVINDSCALLLASPQANMSLVLGTGFNIAYIKDNYIINAEAGRFNKFPREEFDLGPLSEMQVGGAYLKTLISKSQISEYEIYNRAAKIVACEIYKIAEYAGIKHIKIAAEGSVFYNVQELQNLIIEKLNELNADFEFIDGRNKTLIGAALAALV